MARAPVTRTIRLHPNRVPACWCPVGALGALLLGGTMEPILRVTLLRRVALP